MTAANLVLVVLCCCWAAHVSRAFSPGDTGFVDGEDHPVFYTQVGPEWNPLAGSCKGRCYELEEVEPPGCRCDSHCQHYFSCCSDFEEQCVKTEGGFECTPDRCGEERDEEHACHCSQDCLERGDCCSNYQSTCKGESPWVQGDCEEIQTPECPAGFSSPPLIYLCLDGFRASYLNFGPKVLPNIHKLMTCGTSARYIRPVYPTKSFPNLYTLVTGLYPESHGIVGNTVHDPLYNITFSLDTAEKMHDHWLGGEPIWKTARRQGLRAGIFHWPALIPVETKILTLMRWLQLPEDQRPHVYTIHSKQPDSAGHQYGPYKDELRHPLKALDDLIGQVMDGLKQLQLHRCANVILLGDHGIEDAHCDWKEYLSDYPVNVSDIMMIYGSLGRIRPRDPSSPTYDPKDLVANLTCKKPQQHFRPYLKQHLPKRLHYANHHRIEDVQLLVENKWHVRSMPKVGVPPCGSYGDHGFDSKLMGMRSIFTAHGPDFQFMKRVPEFENIEVYNLMCDVLGLEPAPNNGTHGSLNHILKVAPFHPTRPQEVTPPEPLQPPTSEDDHDLLDCSCHQQEELLVFEACRPSVGGAGAHSAWLSEIWSGEEEEDEEEQEGPEVSSKPWMSRHCGLLHNSTQLPFGRPSVMFDTQYSLLHHLEFISGYSKELAMPLWTSYTLQEDLPPTQDVSSSSAPCVRVDSRVSGAHSQSCRAYSLHNQLSFSFLFPPELASSAESRFDASLITNTVPMYPAFKRVWGYLQGALLRRYAAQSGSGINVLVGPVFDHDYDGHRDSAQLIREFSRREGLTVPTHFFTVVTTCREQNQTVDECDGPLDVFSFLLPHREDNSEACNSGEDESHWVEELLKLHTARVRDVELLTGLDLYRSTNLTYSSTLRLKTHLSTFEGDN
ncbi:autotaxin-like [Nelusetta ayraudi]|uniref:autotaxin-like n=1 Tax=Nelusetta ayraudi TaxID=303726 RepID=UPI003F715558